MDQVWDFVRTQFADNEFFKGGFILLLLGSVGYWARRVPSFLWEQIKRVLFVTVSFDERTTLYQLFQSWVSDQKLMQYKRDVILKVNERADPPELLTVPDRRAYWVWIGGVWCRLTKERDKESPGGKGGSPPDSSNMSDFFVPERIWLTCFFWNRKRLLATLHYILREYGLDKEESVPVYQCSWGYWREQCKLPLRSADNLMLKAGQLEAIFQDVREFLSSKEWYEERQIPYQRGYMLCGPPGTGKTTLAVTLASAFRMRLCVLDLASIERDRDLREAFASLPNRAIVLIEDFDSYFQGRKNKINERSSLTFSGLLNAINGVVSSPGRILMITTNISSDVDPALLRAGRIDRVFKLGHVDDDQARRIVRKFLPDMDQVRLDTFCDGLGSCRLSPADLVGHLQKYRFDPDQSLDRTALLAERDQRMQVDEELRRQEEEYRREREEQEREAPPDKPIARSP